MEVDAINTSQHMGGKLKRKGTPKPREIQHVYMITQRDFGGHWHLAVKA